MNASTEILRARELRAPRYTSYPTALEFDARFGAEDYRRELLASNSEPIPAPLLLYLHIPFCRAACHYCGCTKIVSRNEQRHASYCASLRREIALHGALVDGDREVRQIHFGGGTPNLLRPRALAGLLTAVAGAFRLADDCELSLEVDPRVTRPKDPEAWSLIGFNRISVGVQDTDPRVQRAVNRLQTSASIRQLTQAARRSGLQSINYDLIYGLPLQTLDSFRRTLDFVLEQRPERVAAFHYAHLPHRLQGQRAIKLADLPDLDNRLALQQLIQDRLTADGYIAIGMDHFALPEDPLVQALSDGSLGRSFQGYTSFGQCDTIGLGMSAISSVGPCYAQNHSDISAYQQAVDQRKLATARGRLCSDNDLLRRAIIQDIMCRQRVDLNAYAHRLGRDFASHFPTELQALRQLDPQARLVSVNRGSLQVTAAGHRYLRLIAQCFDAYSPARQAQQLAVAV